MYSDEILKKRRQAKLEIRNKKIQSIMRFSKNKNKFRQRNLNTRDFRKSQLLFTPLVYNVPKSYRRFEPQVQKNFLLTPKVSSVPPHPFKRVFVDKTSSGFFTVKVANNFYSNSLDTQRPQVFLNTNNKNNNNDNNIKIKKNNSKNNNSIITPGKLYIQYENDYYINNNKQDKKNHENKNNKSKKKHDRKNNNNLTINNHNNKHKNYGLMEVDTEENNNNNNNTKSYYYEEEEEDDDDGVVVIM